jgi:ATP-dependent DNA helicase RecG
MRSRTPPSSCLALRLAWLATCRTPRSSTSSGPNPASVDFDDRATYRAGYLAIHDAVWAAIDARNGTSPAQEGAFRHAIRAFDERVVREALLNAVAHRNYHHAGSIFVHHSPGSLTVRSPGGLPYGVTLQKILDTSVPRNRLVAETLEGCDLVQRSGQGVNLMFEQTIREGKGRPDYAGTDAFSVVLSLPGVGPRRRVPSLRGRPRQPWGTRL